jgi:hypothetical protein
MFQGKINDLEKISLNVKGLNHITTKGILYFYLDDIKCYFSTFGKVDVCQIKWGNKYKGPSLAKVNVSGEPNLRLKILSQTHEINGVIVGVTEILEEGRFNYFEGELLNFHEQDQMNMDHPFFIPLLDCASLMTPMKTVKKRKITKLKKKTLIPMINLYPFDHYSMFNYWSFSTGVTEKFIYLN